MRTKSIEFRGEQVDIEYRRSGYDHTCNSEDVEWHFSEQWRNERQDLTANEEIAIVDQILSVPDDDYYSDDFGE